MSDGEMAAAAVKKKKMKRRRTCWVRKWIARRDAFGAYTTLMAELALEDRGQYRNFLRMTPENLEEILCKIGSTISRQDTQMRAAIPAKEKLSITLRFLASGDSYASLAMLFRIPQCTISGFVPEVCAAIFEQMKCDFLKVPSDPEAWKTIAIQFDEKWNFPNCIGSIDGKHIVLQSPNRSGSYHYNYKKCHSIVLLAVADSNYKFVFVDVGCNGRIFDGGVFSRSSLASALRNGDLRIPEPVCLPNSNEVVPYVLVADDVFQLLKNVMKPYPFRNQPGPNRIFNYRLSRARRVVENSFGLRSQVFRVFRKPMLLSPDKAESIVLAACVLHNFLLTRSPNVYVPPGVIDAENEDGSVTNGTWRNESISNSFLSLHRQASNNSPQDARGVREIFKDYFVSTSGEVQWQYRHI